MTIIILEKAPSGLRGELSKWMIEVRSGVFVGKVSKLVQDKLWLKTLSKCQEAHALLIYSYSNEQGFIIDSHNPGAYEPIDMEGITLIMRPNKN